MSEQSAASADDQTAGDREAVPEDRRGTPDGMTSQDVDERSEIARFLGTAAFPGDRESLLETARGNGATDRVLSDLGSLPAGEQFENVQAVARSIGLGTEQHRN